MDFIFDPSLVLYLPLYQLDGSSFTSKDAYGHLCTVTGALWRPNGRAFDGTDDIITVPDASSLSPSGAFQMLVWAKLDSSISGTAKGLLSKDDGASAREYLLMTNAGDKQQVYLFASDGANYLIARGTTQVADGKWHFWTISWTGVNATGQIAIDLDLVPETLSVNNKQAAGYVPHDTATDVEPGRVAHDNNSCWKGDIGMALLYTRVFSPLEKQNIYLQTKWRWQ